MHAEKTLLPVIGGNAIEILLNDHTVIKRLLAELTQASDPAQTQQIFEQTKAALTLHNATEENLVYPALSQIAGKHMKSQHLYHETAAADVLVFDCERFLKEGKLDKFKATAETLKAAVLEHIEDEEESAFPLLQKHASPEQDQMLTKSVYTLRSALQYDIPAMVPV